jgi:hypothetical protein
MLELVLKESMDDMRVPLQGTFDVWSGGGESEGKIIRKRRYEVSDGAAASCPSQEKEARAESIIRCAQSSNCP